MGKYPALNTISGVVRAAGWVAIAGAVIVFVVGLRQLPKQNFESMLGIMAMIQAFSIAVLGLMLVLIGEAVRVFIDIEANTSEAARRLAGTQHSATSQTWAASPTAEAKSFDVESEEVQETISLARRNGYDVAVEGNRKITFKSPGGGNTFVYDISDIRRFRKMSGLDGDGA